MFIRGKVGGDAGGFANLEKWPEFLSGEFERPRFQLVEQRVLLRGHLHQVQVLHGGASMCTSALLL